MKKTKDLVKLALKIARKAHNGQFRHDNKTTYITHPIAVAKAVKAYFPKIYLGDVEPLVCAAYLHDVIEDTKLKRIDLLGTALPFQVIDLVCILTKGENQNYLEYLLKIKENNLARIVKIEDIKHNLGTLDPKKKTQRDKYLLALYILEH